MANEVPISPANASGPILWNWSQQAGTITCNASCRFSTALSNSGSWWRDVEFAHARVCWGCDPDPWLHMQEFALYVWDRIHSEKIAVRDVYQQCNIWSFPCHQGIEFRSRGSRCLIGHFSYSVLCFFHWMGVGEESLALLSLESAMDLAWIVQQSTCGSDWGFTVPEIAVNYEHILTTVWHLHKGVPEKWEPSMEPLRCWRGRRREPQELQELPSFSHLPEVLCLVLVVFPAEKKRMENIADTYASSCGALVFLTASSAPAYFRGFPVVDLRKFFHMLPDPQQQSTGSELHNTIEKTLRAFQYAGILLRGLARKPDVVCRLDSDTLFFPQNLARILACRNFSAAAPWALGNENYAHKHQLPGQVFISGGNGICLSRGAVERFLAGVQSNEIKTSTDPGDWNTGRCISAPGHWDDVVLSACLAQFDIPISRWGTDCLGRNLFWPNKLASAVAGPDLVAPPRIPPTVTFFQPPDIAGAPSSSVTSYHHWRYRAWQYLACDPPHWIGDFPVSFHLERNATEVRSIYAAVQQERTIHGYTPRLWSGSLEQCGDLLC